MMRSYCFTAMVSLWEGGKVLGVAAVMTAQQREIT